MSDHSWDVAAASLGLPSRLDAQRPGPLRLLQYVVWGALPPRYAAWILYDTTAPTWAVRHLARLVAAAAVPVVLLLLFLPGPSDARTWTAFGAGIAAVLMAGAWVNESAERRLARAGFGWGTGPALRSRRREVLRAARGGGTR